MSITTPRALRRLGMLGINRRIRDYILPYNPRRHITLVDDKAKTAALAEDAGIAMPRNHFAINYHGEISHAVKRLAALESFVIKPATGSMGNGIIVVHETQPASKTNRKARFRVGRDTWLDTQDLGYHIATVLSGLFSIDGRQDRAIVQERVVTHPSLGAVSYGGVPDIRVILLHGIPVMAMLRVATEESRGRANLHQGAVGLGIDLATGRTTHAMRRGASLSTHPDLGVPLLGIEIPHWHESLLLAARASELFGLGYLGIDVVIGATQGPMLLEANARPGLAIQLANQEGLRFRLQAIETLLARPPSPEARVSWAQANFSAHTPHP